MSTEVKKAETDDAFKYDIAFSFVKEDEGLATQLNDVVQDRYRTFLYSKAQDQLVGTDGEKTFNAVFGEQARTVAVLLRAEWGHTPWTRIEETAIKNRAFNQGYDFATFIVTKPGTPIPAWLPRTRLWFDLERFGIEGAAAVLESRIQQHGGDAVEETLADRASRFQRAQRFAQERDAFQHSEDGVKAAQEAYQRLVADLNSNAALLSYRIKDVQGTTMLVGNGVVLTVRYESFYANSLDKAALVAQFYDGVPRLPGLMALDEPRTLKNWQFKFELVDPGRSGWVGPDRKAHAPEALAEFLLKHFLELQQQRLG
jgi:hypothetical protein